MRLRDLVRDRAVWLYVALTGILFHRPLTTETFFFRDLYLFFYPKKVLLADALRAGTFPLWDPFTNGGQPYLATPTYGAFHPSNVLYAILPTITAFNLIPVLHVLFCAVAAYWLARVVGLSAIGAFVAGTVYAFAGCTLSGANLSAWLLALPWIPMTIGLAHRALRDGRSIVPAAFAAAMPLYAGMAELTAMMFVLLLAWLAAVRIAPLRRRAFAAAVIIAGAIGLSLLCTLPATSVVAQSSRAGVRRSYESFSAWSLHPRRLPELVVPHYFGPVDTLDDRDYWGRKYETEGFPYVLSIYFGVPALLLAILGTMSRGAELPRRTLAALALFALVIALGRYLPGFRLIYDYVPLVTMFRFPVKAIAMTLLPVALLAGCGVELVRRRNVSIAIAVAVVVAADLLRAGFSVNAYAPRELFDPPPLATTVRALVGPMRFYAAPRPMVVRAPSNEIRWLVQEQLRTLDDYTATMFGIPVVYHTDYDQLAPQRIAYLAEVLRQSAWNQKQILLDRAGVRAFTTPDRVVLPGIREVAQIDTPGGPMHLYLNEAAAPARFVGNCVASVRLLRRELNAARYELDAPCDGRVIFAENHYDGWRATVDGRDTPLVRADYAFTSIAVGKGHHAIERRYFPPRLIAGAIGTLITMLALFLLQYASSSRAAATTFSLFGR